MKLQVHIGSAFLIVELLTFIKTYYLQTKFIGFVGIFEFINKLFTKSFALFPIPQAVGDSPGADISGQDIIFIIFPGSNIQEKINSCLIFSGLLVTLYSLNYEA